VKLGIDQISQNRQTLSTKPSRRIKIYHYFLSGILLPFANIVQFHISRGGAPTASRQDGQKGRLSARRRLHPRSNGMARKPLFHHVARQARPLLFSSLDSLGFHACSGPLFANGFFVVFPSLVRPCSHRPTDAHVALENRMLPGDALRARTVTAFVKPWQALRYRHANGPPPNRT
jgi:hypothetical protein